MIAEEELVVGRVAVGFAGDVDFEAEGGARVVGVVAVDFDIADGNAVAVAQIVEGEFGFHIFDAHGEIVVGEHIGEELFGRFVKADRGPDHDVDIGVVATGEGEAGDVIPMSVADEEVDGFVLGGVDGLPKGKDSCSSVENDQIVTVAYF